MFFRIYGVLYIFIYHTYNIYTHIYTSVSLTGDLTSLAQLRLSLWFVTSLPQFVTPLHSVSRASACGSSRLRFSLQFVTPCLWFVTPPPRHYMRNVSSRLSPYQIGEPRCLYDLDLMPNIESPCARTTPTITASHTSLRRNNNIVS